MLIVTTHRILCVHGGACAEFPLHFIQKIESGGGFFSTNRIEVHLSGQKLLNRDTPFYFQEYHTKILQEKGFAKFKWNYPH